MAAELITYTRSKPTVEFTLNGDSQFEYDPSGLDTEVQFNDAGEMAGDAGFVFNKTTNVATLTGGVVAPYVKVGDVQPTADGVAGVEITNAAGTAVVRVDTTSSKVNIGSAANPTAIVDIAASTTSKAHLRLRAGVAPTTGDLTDGCIWFDGTDLFIRAGGVTYTITKV